MVCAVFLGLLISVTSFAAKVNLRSDQDKQFDFRGAKTWGWDVEEQGDVKMARSAEDDPVAIKRQYGPTIVDAITREVTQRGLTPAADASKPPDLRFHYYLLVTVGVNAQVMGQFLPAVPEWGLPPFNAQTSAFSIVQTGSLVLDAVRWLRGLPVKSLVRSPSTFDLALRVLVRTPASVTKLASDINRRTGARAQIARADSSGAIAIPSLYLSNGMPGPFLDLPEPPARGLGSAGERAGELQHWSDLWTTPRWRAAVFTAPRDSGGRDLQTWS